MMNILDVSKEDYKKFVINPFSGFDKVEFIELNKEKVDKIKFFIFENNKNALDLLVGFWTTL